MMGCKLELSPFAAFNQASSHLPFPTLNIFLKFHDFLITFAY